MNELQNFDFKGNSVRTLTVNDEPYFVGKDVANILGLNDQTTQLEIMLMMKIS